MVGRPRKLKGLLRTVRLSPRLRLQTPSSAASGRSKQAAEQLSEVAEKTQNSTADKEAVEQSVILAAKNLPELSQPPVEDFRSLDTLRDGENNQSPGNEKDKAIKAAYERLWDINGGDQYKDLQVRIFQVITSALESLTPQQLIEAARFNPSNPRNSARLDLEELEGLYCNFLKTNSEGYLYFEHLSAEVFVSEMKEEGFGNSGFRSESFLARSCLHYLGATDFDGGTYQTDHELSERLRDPFYGYAARHWVSHFKQADDRDEISKPASSVFKTGSMIFHEWFPIYWVAVTTPKWSNPKFTGLMAASYFGLESVVRILLKEEPDINIEAKDAHKGHTPVWWAADNGHDAVVRLLLDKGAHVETKDWFGQTLLFWAAKKGHGAVVRLLLNKDAQVEAKDRFGRTPLSWAAQNGHEAIMQALLDKGANTEAKDYEYGWTPLFCAADNGYETVVQLLLDKGANIEAKDRDGGTPLLGAAYYGHKAVVQVLLDNGAHIEAKSNSGRTPLWCAANEGYEAVVRLLLDNDAHVEVKDGDGRTPLRCAADKGYKAIVQLLESHLA